MSGAREAFACAVADVEFAEPSCPVIANVTALPHERSTLAERLVSQLDSPVRWEESVRYLLARGATEFVEVAPGGVLSKLIATIAGSSVNVRQLDPTLN
jgi:trans-AT polyketide synthase/acyltransferase/oxidoreductase domain-containing protein